MSTTHVRDRLTTTSIPAAGAPPFYHNKSIKKYTAR